MFTGADDVNIDKGGAGELVQFHLDWYEYEFHFFVFTNFLTDYSIFSPTPSSNDFYYFVFFLHDHSTKKTAQLCFPSLYNFYSSYQGGLVQSYLGSF